jgi:hypothetical protein
MVDKSLKRKGFVVTEVCKQLNTNCDQNVNNLGKSVAKEMSINRNALEMNGKQGVSDKCVQSMDTTSDSMRECSDNALINSDYNCDHNHNYLISDSPLHRLIPYTTFKTKERQLVAENNLKVIKGKFSPQELQILRHNFDVFCREFNCDEDMKTRLLGFFAFTDKYSKSDRKMIKDFMRREKFYLRLANGLPNRTVKHISDTARVKFHSLKTMNDLTPDERHQMKTLHQM